MSLRLTNLVVIFLKHIKDFISTDTSMQKSGKSVLYRITFQYKV